MILAKRRHLLAAGAAGLGARAASAQERYPSRALIMVIPWAAGGPTDTFGRVLAQAMAEDLGQPVVVENRGGASGTVGHGHVARARPDGYTFLLGTNSTYAIAPHLMRGLPYDNRASFVGISLVARSPQTLSVHPSVRANTVAEFLALVRSKPGEVTFSSAGIGASSHLATEMLMAKTQTRMLHVPYRGGGPSAQALIAGEVSCSFVDFATALPLHQAGQLRILGVSTTQRLAQMPDVPTLAESGVPGFESSTDTATFLPAGTPREIVDRLGASVRKALTDPATRQRITTLGFEVVGSTPAEFDVYWTREIEKWGEVIRGQNITLG